MTDTPASKSVYNCAVAGASVDTLRKVPLFADLDKKELEKIAQVMRERRFAAGDTVTKEGASGVGFFIIEDGTADVTVAGAPVGSIGPGDYFGEVALLTGSARTATIIATTDMLCYGMAQWQFRPLVDSQSAIGTKLRTAMAEREGSPPQ